jgi:hypothetical protein
LENSSFTLQRVKEDFKYVLSESGFAGESRWRSSRLFLCDNSHEREILAELLCRRIPRQDPDIPGVSFRVSAPQGPDRATRHIATVLSFAAEKWLSQSPFNALDLSNLTTFDLRILIRETLRKFSEEFRWKKKPIFVIVIADVSETELTLSTLNLLRSMVSEGEGIVWNVFTSEVILDVIDPSGVSPFYNLFPVCDLASKFATIPNLYQVNTPVTGEMFFGRNQIRIDIQQSIAEGSYPIALWGPRKIGKTSLVFSLIEPLRASCIPVYVDCLQIGTRSDLGLLYGYIAQDAIWCGQQQYGFSEGFSISGESICYDELIEIVSRVEQRTHSKVIFLFDEIEILESIEDGLMALRVLAEDGRVGLIIGGLRVKLLLSDLQSPIYEAFVSRRLGCLDKGAAVELITHPVKETVWYESEAIEEVLHLVGTHPFLVRGFCSLVLAILNRDGSNIVTIETVQSAYREYLRASDRYVYVQYHLKYLDSHIGGDPVCSNILKSFARPTSRRGTNTMSMEDILEDAVGAGIISEGSAGRLQVLKGLEYLCDGEVLEVVNGRYNLKAKVYLDVLAMLY